MKIPVQAINASIEMASGLKELAAAVETPEFNASISPGQFKKEASDSKSKFFETPTEVSGELAARGHDDVCVYLGGLLTTKTSDDHQTQSLGTCMTIAGTKIIALNAYQNSTNPTAYKALLTNLKSWALQIKPRP